MRIESPTGILVLLSALNLLNYIDRYVVAAVLPRIEETFSLSKAEAGWVMSAFMVGYFLTSPLFGAVGDRAARRGLLAGGIGVWSLATFASGLAPSFVSLLWLRGAVGIGEASYATLSPTIIDDLSISWSKNRRLAVFYVAIPAGSALGYMLGGSLEPLVGWRGALMVVGGPGLLAAAVTMLLREPVRARRVTAAFAWREALLPLWHARQYVGTVAGYVAYTFALGGFAAWAPTYAHQVLGVPLARADLLFGGLTVLTGVLGTAAGGALGHRLVRQGDRGQVAGWLRFSALTSLVGFPFAWAALLQLDSQAFFVLLGVAELCLFASTSPVNAAILESVPQELRATAMAVSIFAIHALGDLISPPLVGFVADRSSLGSGLELLPVAVLLSAIAWWVTARWARAGAPEASGS